MSTFALKVSIDGIKYAIRGIDKETSRKEVLCTVAKYRREDELSELQAALSTLDGSISIVKFQKLNEASEIKSKNPGTCRSLSKSRSFKMKKKCSVSKRASFSDKSTLGENMPEEKVKLCNGSGKMEAISRSRSMSEKDRRRTLKRTGEWSTVERSKGDRPRSFAAFDADKRRTFHRLTVNKCTSFDGNLLEIGKLGRRTACDDSDPETAKSNGGKLKNLIRVRNNDDADRTTLLKMKNTTEVEVKEGKKQARRDKLQSWLENMQGNSYFINNAILDENCRSNCIIIDYNNNEVEGDEATENDCKKTVKEQGEGGLDNGEGETDSGLPSIGYESSIDTLSRDERVSFDQSWDEGEKELQNDSGFDCSSLNDNNNATELCKREKVTRLRNCQFISQDKEEADDTLRSATVELVEDEEIYDGKFIDSSIWEEILTIIKGISKTDEHLLHNELLISQLEFQLEILSDDCDIIDDVEVDEIKLVSELKEAEQFLNAITKLNHYLSDARRELLSESRYLDEKIKERQVRLQLMERKLLKREFRLIPRHLYFSKGRRNHFRRSLVFKEEDAENGHIFEVEENSISFV